jgi:flagellum-specific ATP synthase
VSGSDPKVDWAIEKIEAVNGFLRQGMDEGFDFETVIKQLIEIFEDSEQ